MKNLIKLRNDVALLDPDVSAKIADFERQVRAIKEQEDDLKKAIMDEMETKGIIKVETEDLLISYVAKTDREKFDSKKFRKDNPDLFDEYVSMIPVKASIRIKVKERR